MTIGEILARKRDGGELSAEEIAFFVRGIVDGSIADYQAAAWLMAIFIRGMSRRETRDLTLAMRDSGERIDLSDLDARPALDKHSTGGVGDKTTLVVVPILAAVGVPMLKMSGRGLGFSGGTVDKLESIPGFRTELSVAEAKDQVRRIGAALIGQSANLAPADKMLYGLRDVTATIESLPLIGSSIMSKKLAAGAERIVLDVKAGRGAFMRTRQEAEALAALLIELGTGAGVPTSAVLSSMDEPLGRAVGNALEVAEALCLLRWPDTAEPVFAAFCRDVAAHALVSANRAPDRHTGGGLVDELLRGGAANRKFAEIVAAQGGPAAGDGILAALPRAPIERAVSAPADGTIVALDARKIGELAMRMGAGRAKKSDAIDPAVGILLHAKNGGAVRAGDPLATLHIRQSDAARAPAFEADLLAACTISDDPKAEVERFWSVVP
ncbi:MAG TPA: thymidine phosphorylase [Chthonomonadaceae bacterium]|nr:thymidine phosphorylase [Chthonomonadaceae bacterium]